MKVLSMADPSPFYFNMKPNSQGRLKFIIQVSGKEDNQLQVLNGDNSNEWGLYVPPVPVSKVISRFPLTWTGNARGQDGNENRRVLQVSTVGMGIIHLDMQITNTGTIATLPNDAPTPVSLIEMQLGDGSVYIDGGSRNVIATGNVQRNKRYIVDMVGFFR